MAAINPKLPEDNSQSQQKPFHQKSQQNLSKHSLHIKSVVSRKFTANEQEIFLTCKRQADQGYADAQIQTGLCYEEGEGIDQSYSSAVHYYQLAADQGQVKAQFLLALLYENGKGVEQSYSQAIRYYKLAAKKGLSSAYVKLGQLYAEGKGIQQSFKKAIEYYQKAAENDCSLAWIYLAEAYEKGHGVEKSQEKANFFYQKNFQSTKKKADAGHPEAQSNLGSLFEEGKGVEKSLENAFHYYQLSADQNSSAGLFNLAECFAKGKGTLKSIEKAIHYYELLATQGDILAQFTLAHYLLKNKINEQQAVHYLKTVIQTEKYNLKLIASCQRTLGKCYEDNSGVEKSEQDAFYYYKLAADSGNETAQHRLGNAYLKGELGLEKSFERAIYFYKLAADQGYSLSLEKLGECYEKGEGVIYSPEQAFHYYELASKVDIKDGYHTSIFVLARCYKMGIGTPKSLEKALFYYKLAAENGYPRAYDEVGYCYQAMGGEENNEKANAYFKMSNAEIKNKFENEIAVMKTQHVFNFIGKAQISCLSITCKKIKAKMESKLNGIQNTTQQAKSNFSYKRLTVNGRQLKSNSSKDDIEKFYALGLSYMKNKGSKIAREQAFYYFKLAADHGHTKAQCLAAYCYKMACGTKKILQEAVKYYKLAADAGFKNAQYALAECFRMGGKNVKESWKDALYYYRLAANQGHLKAIKLLFEAYHYGKQVKQSYEEALYYLKLGEKFQDPESYHQLGRYYQEGQGNLKPSFFEALKCYKFAAAKGHEGAKRTLILLNKIIHPHAQLIDISSYLLSPQPSKLKALFESYEGKPIFLNEYEFNKEEAQAICEAMIENSHLTVIASKQCINELVGAFELKGYDREQDLNDQSLTFSSHQSNLYGCVFIASKTDKGKKQSSFKYLTGLSSDAEASFYVSPFYLRKGIENSKNPKKTFNLFKKLADKGHVEAQFYVSIFYLNGQGTEKSEKKAFHYAKLAADQGLAEAQYNLAHFYKEEVGVKKSQEKFHDYLKLAAQQDLACAQHTLAKLFQKSKFKEDTEAQVLDYHQKLIKKNYIPTLIDLGLYYLEIDAIKARIYFQKALNHSNLNLFYERWRLENHIERCKKQMIIQNDCARAKKIHEQFPINGIFYPKANQLDVRLYPEKERLKLMKNIFTQLKDQPLHLYVFHLSYEEIILIRDSMLENPRLTVVCTRSDRYSLCEAFNRFGFKQKNLKEMRLFKKDAIDWYGYLFVG